MDNEAVGIVNIFSFYGRIGRVRYLAYTFSSLFVGLLIFSIIFSGLYFFVPPQIGIVVAGVVFTVLTLAVLYFIFMFSVQRCHDVNLPAWAAVIIFVPFVQVYLFLMPGTEGDNNYGSQPVLNSRGVYISLATIPVVIILIALLTSVAVPAYKTFLQEASNIKPPRPNLLPRPPQPRINNAENDRADNVATKTEVEKKSSIVSKEKPAPASKEAKTKTLVPSGNAVQEKVIPKAKSKPEAIQKRNVVAPDIPRDELKGLLLRRAFTPDKATIKNGVLEIRQGNDAVADLKLTIFTNLAAPYSGKALKILPVGEIDAPRIQINYKKNRSDDFDDKETVTKNYEMYLEFGEQQNAVVPLRLILKTALATQINIAGNIQVMTPDVATTQQAVKDTVKSGQNRQVAIQQDSLDTIKYLGNEYIKKQFPGELITLTSTYWLLMENAPDGSVAASANQHAEYAAEFSVGSAGTSRLFKLQLLKKATGWQVVNKLDNNLIFAAHPLEDRNWLKDPTLQGPKVLAARHFELNKYQQSSWQALSEPSLRCGQNSSIGVSYCEVRYKRRAGADTACQIDTYIFDKKYGQWRIRQILPTDQQLSSQDGRIIERKQSNMMCF